MLDGLREHMPELYQGLKAIGESLGEAGAEERLKQEYERFPNTSIDYGLMEKAENRVVIPASVGWSDLGDWPSFKKLLDSDKDGNNHQGEVLWKDSENNIAFNDTEVPIVALGLDDLVIVNTEEAVLVMDKGKAQQVKEMAKKFDERPGGRQ